VGTAEDPLHVRGGLLAEHKHFTDARLLRKRRAANVAVLRGRFRQRLRARVANRHSAIQNSGNAGLEIRILATATPSARQRTTDAAAVAAADRRGAIHS